MADRDWVTAEEAGIGGLGGSVEAPKEPEKDWLTNEEAMVSEGLIEPREQRISKAIEQWRGREIEGDEGIFAAKHPNIYSAGRAFFDILPWGRYVSPEAREEFLALDKQHQIRALLWGSVETMLLTPGAIGGAVQLIGKGLAPGVKLAGRFAKQMKGKGLLPIESLPLEGSKPFYYELAAKGKMKRLGVTAEEAAAITEENIPQFLMETMGTGKSISPGFRKMLEWTGPRRMPQLTQEAKLKLGPSRLRAEHYGREWKKVFKQQTGKEYTEEMIDSVLRKQVVDILGKEKAAKYALENASPLMMANLFSHLVRHPNLVTSMKKAGQYTSILPDYFAPTRVIFGGWEKAYGAFQGIYRPVTGALRTARGYGARKTLTFFEMLEQNGLGKVIKKRKGKVAFDFGFGAKEAEAVHKAAKEIDNLTSLAVKNPDLAAGIKRDAERIVAKLGSTERRLLSTWRRFSDSLYADYMSLKVPSLFERAGLTPAGMRGVDSLTNRMIPKVSHALSPKEGLAYTDRLQLLEKTLGDVRNSLQLMERGKHPWFKAEGIGLERQLRQLRERLTMTSSKGGKFPAYLENYVARIGQLGTAKRDAWTKSLMGEMRGYFAKGRSAPIAGISIDDFGSMVGSRVTVQASDLFLYPALGDAIRFAEKLPPYVREFTEHWASRLLNRPSMMDEKLARFFQRFGGKHFQGWDERRIRQSAITLNNWAFVGGLGFKPVSILRNLFQPTVTVPADLGGFRGFADLTKGYIWATKSANRAYIRKIGAIQEFLPEQAVGKVFFPGQAGRRGQQIRDAALWAYKGSDSFNRYVSGGAAVNRWNSALGKVINLEGASEPAIRRFAKKVGLDKRYPWIRNEIEGLLRRGRVGEAKDSFVRDIISDTQWLYGLAETPVASQKYGAIGKTGMIFQTWWMSYGASLEKWLRTGTGVTPKVERMFTWMVSSAIASTALEQVTGRRYAAKSVFLGPFPTTINRYLLPPAWTPFVEFAGLLASIPPTLVEGDTKKLLAHTKALARSVSIFIPAGLQLETSIKGTVEEGWPGLAKSIIKYQRAKDYELPFAPWFE